MRGKKGRNKPETGLSGNVVASLFPSHNIYSALLQRIEHCST